ncbi:MAG: hypothetical protein J5787_09855 [Alphaproteobacteria bacterium]|nr:hypothetical protein [Alphaproteobacteria bacterium]
MDGRQNPAGRKGSGKINFFNKTAKAAFPSSAAFLSTFLKNNGKTFAKAKKTFFTFLSYLFKKKCVSMALIGTLTEGNFNG